MILRAYRAGSLQVLTAVQTHDFTRLLLTYLFFSISLNQTLKVLRTADFAPLVVFIAPTNTAAQVPKTLSRIRSGTLKRL